MQKECMNLIKTKNYNNKYLDIVKTIKNLEK